MKILINGTDYINRIKNFTLSGSTKTITRTLKFSFISWEHFNQLPMPSDFSVHAPVALIGDDGTTLFLGNIISMAKNATSENVSISCMDFGYILTNNVGRYVFDSSAKMAISTICSDLGITLGDTTHLNETIHYACNSTNGEAISTILTAILDELAIVTKEKYSIYFDGEILTINAFEGSPTLTVMEGQGLLGCSQTIDIVSFCNVVDVLDDNGRTIDSISRRADSEPVLKRSITKKDNEDYKLEAEKILDDSSVSVLVSAELFGDFSFICGRNISILDTQSGVLGNFHIISFSHSYESGRFISTLELEEAE